MNDMPVDATATKRASGAGVAVIEELCEERVYATGAQLAVSVGATEPMCAAVGTQVGERPLRNEHLFDVWCASKPVSAVVLLALLEEAGFNLIDTVSSVTEALSAHGHVPLARLLNHSAGLRRPDMATAKFMPLQVAVTAARTRFGRPPLEAFSEFSSSVIICDLIDVLSQVGIAAVSDSFLTDNNLYDDIVFDVPDVMLDDPLEHLGFYILDTKSLARPMYGDAIADIAQSNRYILGAYANARGLCRFYQHVGRVLSGETQPGFPSPRYLSDTIKAHGRSRTWDDTLNKECSFSAGFMTALTDHGYGSAISPQAVGHTGLLGGSFGFYDPRYKLSVAGILNGMSRTSDDSAYWRSRVITAIIRAT